MKPEFSKPFDLAQAAAGAPISKINGDTARFVAYAEEADPACCVIVIEYRSGLIGTRRKSGRVNETGATDNPNDLIMLPLGLLDGKPVFVGDQLEQRDRRNAAWIRRNAQPGDRYTDNGEVRWPAPAKAYPQSTLIPDHLRAEYNRDLGGPVDAAMQRVANAALRHAVDAGQVVPKDEHEAALHHLGEQLKGASLSDQAARDIVVATAVHNACMTLAADLSTNFYLAAQQIDIGAIVASVPA